MLAIRQFFFDLSRNACPNCNPERDGWTCAPHVKTYERLLALDRKKWAKRDARTKLSA